MKLIDISLTLSPDLPTWPGDPRIELRRISEISEGSDANVTHLSLAVHAGTHVDAPDHFLGNGKGVDQIPLGLLIGPARVIELPEGDTITADMLREANLPAGTTRVLCKTRNSRYWAEGVNTFQEDFMALDEGAAGYLVEQGVKVIGVDYLSVAPFHAPVPTHRILLEAEMLVIEGLNVSGVDPGEYTLYCLPLKIAGADGAPARVLLSS
jgi:arylformamidase